MSDPIDTLLRGLRGDPGPTLDEMAEGVAAIRRRTAEERAVVGQLDRIRRVIEDLAAIDEAEARAAVMGSLAGAQVLVVLGTAAAGVLRGAADSPGLHLVAGRALGVVAEYAASSATRAGSSRRSGPSPSSSGSPRGPRRRTVTEPSPRSRSKRVPRVN